ncbi:MAG: DciA family protein [Candidatus Omnitrophota bacterium]
MKEIKQVLQAVFKELTDKQSQTHFDKAVKELERVVGKRAGQHCKIVYLTKDKIQVNVDSSVWLHELNIKKRHLEKQLRESLSIKTVVLRLGEV